MWLHVSQQPLRDYEWFCSRSIFTREQTIIQIKTNKKTAFETHISRCICGTSYITFDLCIKNYRFVCWFQMYNINNMTFIVLLINQENVGLKTKKSDCTLLYVFTFSGDWSHWWYWKRVCSRGIISLLSYACQFIHVIDHIFSNQNVWSCEEQIHNWLT